MGGEGGVCRHCGRQLSNAYDLRTHEVACNGSP